MTGQHGRPSVGAARRRRQMRLRRTITVAVFLALVTALAAVLAQRGDDGGVAAAPAASPRAAGAAARTATTATAGMTSGKPGATAAPARVAPKRSASNDINAPVTGTTNLEPEMTAAYERAEAAARQDGVALEIYAGWRSAEWQQVLFDRAVEKYGSKEAASKWVLPPGKSAHVKGFAIDVRPRAAGAWLERHGAAYGLCRLYDNEWWHFELVRTDSCPARLPSAAG